MGRKPSDLDLHVRSKYSNSDIHVYYEHMKEERNGLAIIELDRDDTDGYGPETITLRTQRNTPYVFCVQDYSNKADASSSSFAKANASITIYRGNELLESIYFPTTIYTTGSVWNAFVLYNNEIKLINTIDSIVDTVDVGKKPLADYSR